MKKAAKGTKRKRCNICQQEKLVKGGFKNGQTGICVECEKGRPCAQCCVVKPASDFTNSTKRHCKQCNDNKDTAEHVEVCASEGCNVAFQRNPDTFTWRPCQGKTSNWNTKCKTCCAPKPKQQPVRCSKCEAVKPPEEFIHGLECKSCRAERSKEETAAKAASRTRETAPRPVCCSQPDCKKPFCEEDWRGYRESEGRWDAQCKACYNGKKYSQRTRAHETSARRQQRLDVSAVWRQHAKADVEQAWKGHLAQARARGLPVDMEVADLMKRMLTMPCEYCGYQPQPGDSLNGLDRVDSTIRSYEQGNIVTSCCPCNRLKGSSSLEEFLDKAWEQASSGDFHQTVSRVHIVTAFRSLSSHDASQRLSIAGLDHEQMCYIAMHNGYEF